MATKTCKKVIYDRKPLYGRQLAVVLMDDEADESTARIVCKSTDKWEEEEAQLERRRNRRRKQFAEAAAELAKQRRSDLRRRREQSEPESYQEPAK